MPPHERNAASTDRFHRRLYAEPDGAGSAGTGTLAHARTAIATAVPRHRPSAPHSYGALVARAAQAGVGGPCERICHALERLAEPLPWIYSYPPRDDGAVLEQRIAFAELVGPDGPTWAPESRLGFTVMAEHTLYPMHHHPAVELYLVLAGNALWRTDAEESIVPPGRLVLHSSEQRHEMRTFEEPLLALWSWSGDLDSPAAYI